MGTINLLKAGMLLLAGCFIGIFVLSGESQLFSRQQVPGGSETERQLTGTSEHGEHGQGNSSDVHRSHAHEAEKEGSHGAHRINVRPVDATSVGIQILEAESGTIETYAELPGEVGLNEDKLCHIVPGIAGTISEAPKSLGDTVKKGEIVAVLNSRELAEARSRYLVFLKREELAQTNFNRIEQLWKKKVSAEKEYLDAKAGIEQARIERIAAAQKLFALGLTEDEIADQGDRPDAPLMRYNVTAPFNGTVITKHMARGEWVSEDRRIMSVADLSEVWVRAVVYPDKLDLVKRGQKAVVKCVNNGLEAIGVVSYVGPFVGEETRTAEARIVIPNPNGLWRPGLFVTVALLKARKSASVTVENEAIQYHKKQPIVFVPNEDHFEIRNVVLGLSDKHKTEIRNGISHGERYAAANSFALKAELERSGAVCTDSH